MFSSDRDAWAFRGRYTGRVVRLRFPELAGVGRIGECAFVFQE